MLLMLLLILIREQLSFQDETIYSDRDSDIFSDMSDSIHTLSFKSFLKEIGSIPILITTIEPIKLIKRYNGKKKNWRPFT